MKNLFKNIAIFFVVFSFAACSNDDVDFAPKSLEVTPHNMSGYWMLSEYNGQEIPEGLFCYVEYIRKNRKFVMYQKFDSMYPRRITGVFSIEKDKYGKYILSGKYDYGMGEWNNKYFVTELLESSMILTADSENAEISKYIRCNEIPEDIIESAK
jgi:hypothetical protein